ncbi:shikimate kinase [Sulfitobacter sp. S190]|uniref:shikimate kinase n=1 Tax=Sulfitobacter sp. S190 TaxID=2867022 RepID=UPI0021A379F3|nr:shikimate kinase [Sulfitobacter sp. S190]UWR20902.1 shikimate kinase [Sulfitobacter sp. S190]
MSEIEQTMADASRFRLKKTVALVGMMGAGKTAVGRAVAAKLGVPFLDSDAEIEAAANQTVPEIFERDGEPFFRARETEIIKRLLETQAGILSTGGGAYLSQVNRENITRQGVALWLDADLSLLWSRVKHRDTRPLLRTADPLATLTEIYETRTPIYALSDLSVRCVPDTSIEAMADRVIDVLLTRADVLERNDA